MLKILAGGFHHETNTFSPSKTPYEDFEMADGWPPLCAGQAMLEAVKGVNIPIAGFCDEAIKSGTQIAPLLWCSAQPAGAVTSDAFEKITSQMISTIQQQLPADAIFLDLHGAMVAEKYDDGEGEILSRVRNVVGEIPIFLALDFHANMSPLMVELADFILPYRNYPHTDMAETGKQVYRFMEHRLASGMKIHKAMSKADFLVPITSQCTLADPAKSILGEILKLEDEYSKKTNFISISMAYGFPLADVEFCGPTILAYSDSSELAENAVRKIATLFNERRKDFSIHLMKPHDAILKAISAYKGKPIILTDTQDNPGAGGASDGVEILSELVRLKAETAIVATVYDPEIAAMAHSQKNFQAELGGKSGTTGAPLKAEFKVVAIGDGKFEGNGPMYGGSQMNLGKCALLETGGVHVIVSSVRQQAADRGIFLHLGVNPEDYKIISLKSSVHFRADFDELAGDVIFIDAEGINTADPSRLPYKKCRRPSA